MSGLKQELGLAQGIPMLKYAKNGMFEAIINHESEQIRSLDNAYTDILNKAVKIRSTRANQLAELAHQFRATAPWG